MLTFTEKLPCITETVTSSGCSSVERSNTVDVIIVTAPWVATSNNLDNICMADSWTAWKYRLSLTLFSWLSLTLIVAFPVQDTEEMV